MNRHQVKGFIREVAGRVQQKVGKATGSTSQQVKGLGRQVVGKTQRAFGDAQRNADKARGRL